MDRDSSSAANSEAGPDGAEVGSENDFQIC